MAEDGRLSARATSELSQTTTTTTTTTTIINPFVINFPEEDKYYLLAFKYCDADNSGHVTTTELKNAFEWMNKNAFMGRKNRQVSYPYVNAILKRGDVDSSLTLDYAEFSTGAVSIDDTIRIFKEAGYVFNEDWVPFLKQYQDAAGTINAQRLASAL